MWKKIIYKHFRFGSTLIVLMVIPLILGGVFLFSRSHSTQALPTRQIAIENPSQNNTSVDSDGDGLKDWEEQIYTTDPKNPDSDHDGTNDGEEIAQARDPLKQGPDDQLTQKTALEPVLQDSDKETDTNLTKKIAEIFGRDYLLNLIQNPNQKQDFDAIADKMVQTALEQSISHITLFTVRDLRVSQETSAKDIENYLIRFDNALISAFDTSDPKRIADAITHAISNQDDDIAYAELTKIIEAYGTFFDAVKTLPVPEDFVALHLDYLNTAMREKEAIVKISDIKNDALRAVVGIREFTQTTIQFATLSKQYNQLAINKGVAPKTP